jgi:lactoylglutathione lyase
MRVPDVDAEMRAMSAALGVTWARVQHTDVRSVWTPERGAEVVSLTFTYTCEGPQHIELLQGSPASTMSASGPTTSPPMRRGSWRRAGT